MRWAVTSLFAVLLGSVAAACASFGTEGDGDTAAAPVDTGEGGAADAAPEIGIDGPAPTDAGDGGCATCTRIVFVTSVMRTGDIGGLSGADMLCTDLAAQTATLELKGRRFLAWLSSATKGAQTRHVHGTAGYLNPKGELIAKDWNDLTDGSLLKSIDVNEKGQTVLSDEPWTGTKAGGGAGQGLCGNWTSNAMSGEGTRGSTTSTGSTWTENGIHSCDESHRFYCIEK